MMFHLPLPAKANDCPPQNENPIINFSLNEDDTTCYTHHYLRAQESCYEQYLREHNMKILTAEDADDSYDELKKTVLAKQMYGDSYLLMVDTVAQRTMITKVDGTYVADVHVALVDSTWYMWLSVDPLADKYPGNTPYMYCNGNPIMLIDPDGLWAEVSMNDDGTYTVINGIADDDRNIYITQNGERTGEVLGQMATNYSFFNEAGEVIYNAVINMQDNSGVLFLEEFMQNIPSLYSYVFGDHSQNGRTGGRYDFKVRGFPYDANKEYSGNDIYRGMPMVVDGQNVIGSARDVGNYAAGYIAGINGIPYSVTRMAFDIYNQRPEPAVSQAAQIQGHNNGYKQYLIFAICINPNTLCR